MDGGELQAWVIQVLDERDKRYEQRFDDQEKARTIALQGLKELLAQEKESRNRAIEKADASLVEYKEKSNEFRSQLDRQGDKFATVDMVRVNSKRIDVLEERANQGKGSVGFIQWIIPIAISAGAIFIAFFKR